MRKKSYAVQVPESVYQMLSEIASNNGISKFKAVKVMADGYVECLAHIKTGIEGAAVSPIRGIRHAD